MQLMTTPGGINATAMSFAVSDTSTWKSVGGGLLGSNGEPFVVAIDYNTTNEEKVLCSGISSNTINISQRGYDGTTAVSHNSTSIYCVPVFTATEANEANQTVVGTLGQVTAVGDLLIGSGTNTMSKLAIGSSGKVLTSNGTTATWATPTVVSNVAWQKYDTTAYQATEASGVSTPATLAAITGITGFTTYLVNFAIAQSDTGATNGATLSLSYTASAGTLTNGGNQIIGISTSSTTSGMSYVDNRVITMSSASTTFNLTPIITLGGVNGGAYMQYAKWTVLGIA